MKSFIFSLVAVLFLVLLVILNGLYIKNATSELSKATSKIQSRQDADFLASMWQENKLLISFSASHKEIDKIEEQLEILKICLENDDKVGFLSSRSLLINCFEQIKRHEQVTLDNII